jgi:hypothetical protein
MVPTRSGGYDACHLWSRSQYTTWCAGLASLFYPSLPLILVKAVLCPPNGQRSIDALSCCRIRILSPGDTDIRCPVHAGDLLCGFYRYICRALADAPSDEEERNPAAILKWIPITTGHIPPGNL